MLELIKKINITMDSVILKNKEIDDTDLDGEKVMMDLDKGKYYLMNEVGSRIWELVDEEITVGELIKVILNEYEVEQNQCEAAVINFIRSLSNSDLVKIKNKY